MPVSAAIRTIICRFVRLSGPTKSSVGVNVMTSHGLPKLPGKRVKDALMSSPPCGERNRKSSRLVSLCSR